MLQRKARESETGPGAAKQGKSVTLKKAKSTTKSTAKGSAKGRSTTASAARKKAPQRAPQKVSGWRLFSAARRPALAQAVAAEAGELAKGPVFGLVTKRLAEEWKALPAAQRAKFAAGADATNAEASAEGASKRPGPKPESRAKPALASARRVSAYQLFSKSNRAEAEAEVGSRAVGPVSQALSKRWKALGSVDRAGYEQKAREKNTAAEAA